MMRSGNSRGTGKDDHTHSFEMASPPTGGFEGAFDKENEQIKAAAIFV